MGDSTWGSDYAAGDDPTLERRGSAWEWQGRFQIQAHADGSYHAAGDRLYDRPIRELGIRIQAPIGFAQGCEPIIKIVLRRGRHPWDAPRLYA